MGRALKRSNKVKAPAGILPTVVRDILETDSYSLNDVIASEQAKVYEEHTKAFQEKFPGMKDVVVPTIPVVDGDFVDSEVIDGRSPGVTHDSNERRKEKIVQLSLAGMSTDTIRKRINANAAVQRRQLLTSDRQVDKIISRYYNDQMPSAKEMNDHELGMREAMFKSMDKLAEKVMLHIQKRPIGERKAFEYIQAIEAVFRIKQQIAENRNWNASRHNPLVHITVGTKADIANRASDEATAGGFSKVLALLDESLG